MAGVSVSRLNQGPNKASGLSWRRLKVTRTNLKYGYDVEIAPYPDSNGKYLIRVMAPSRRGSGRTVDSYFEIVAKNQNEARKFLIKDAMWDGALLGKIAREIGRKGEKHFVEKLKTTGIPRGKDPTWPDKSIQFDEVKKYPNASDNGLDVLARIKSVNPPPPPRPPGPGDFMAFEVKSTLGIRSRVPGIRGEQTNPDNFTKIRLNRARDGVGSYPQLLKEDKDFIAEALETMGEFSEEAMIFRKGEIQMTHAGDLKPDGFNVSKWEEPK